MESARQTISTVELNKPQLCRSWRLGWRRRLAVILVLGCAVPAPLVFADSAASQEAAVRVSTGAQVFDHWCSDCHRTAQGPGSMAIQRRYQGALPAILEQRQGMNPDYIGRVVRRGVSFMPSFRKTEISDAELALLADYLASSPGRAGE